MNNIIYCKTNRMRLPRFQVQTFIVEVKGTLVVKKKALVHDARPHIASIFRNIKSMIKYFPSQYSPDIKIIDADTIEIEYLTYQSIEEKIFDFIVKKDRKNFFLILDDFCKFVKSFSQYVPDKYDSGDFDDIDFLFEPIFVKNGLVVPEKKCILNFDMNVENILFQEDCGYILIDHEWIFKTSLDWKFSLFRSMHYLFNRYSEYLNNFVSFYEIMVFFKISKEECSVFMEIEVAFQKFIHGESADFGVNQEYLKENKNVFEYINSLETLGEENNKKIIELENERNFFKDHLENIQKSRAWKLTFALVKIRLALMKLFRMS